jgi:SAM-dependent methyltransferase
MARTGEDWEQLYRSGDTGWDLQGVTPPLRALIEAGGLRRLGLGAGSRVAVPGCGRGHDLAAFAELGMQVTGFDISPTAVAQARANLARADAAAKVLCRDVLGLLPEFERAFDLVYDYTCLCALPPRQRADYAQVVAGILAPGGHLLALVYPMRADRAGEGGPPYLVTEEQLRALFDPRLEPAGSFAAERSLERREGAERWYSWRAGAACSRGSQGPC